MADENPRLQTTICSFFLFRWQFSDGSNKPHKKIPSDRMSVTIRIRQWIPKAFFGGAVPESGSGAIVKFKANGPDIDEMPGPSGFGPAPRARGGYEAAGSCAAAAFLSRRESLPAISR